MFEFSVRGRRYSGLVNFLLLLLELFVVLNLFEQTRFILSLCLSLCWRVSI